MVQFYMHAIQENAERSVRHLLRRIDERFKGQNLVAVDYMDDGSPIHLKIDIDPERGKPYSISQELVLKFMAISMLQKQLHTAQLFMC